MNLKSKKNLSKADEPLREALKQAEPKQTLQAVVVLDPAADAGAAAEPFGLGETGMQMESRKATIARRARELADQLGPTLQALRALGLEVRGGRLGRTIVVKGAARDLLASLDISGVRQAALDRLIGLGDSAVRRKGRGKG